LKPLTNAILDRADHAIADARKIIAIDVVGQAARLAYHAQFHTARALIYERMDRVAKTHKGVRTLFHQLAKDEPSLNIHGPERLTSSYQFKEAVDYETGDAATVSREDAEEAIEFAEKFLATVRQILTLQAS
jgi:uncharacterized protein (UPF0332 family)